MGRRRFARARSLAVSLAWRAAGVRRESSRSNVSGANLLSSARTSRTGSGGAAGRDDGVDGVGGDAAGGAVGGAVGGAAGGVSAEGAGADS
eukprot:2158383-Prymnesium_polylepis.1